MKIWRAAEFGDPQKLLKREELDSPGLGSDRGFRLQVLACGVGLPDLLMMGGQYPLVTKPPVSPGQECVGIVTEAGPKCEYKLGDRVMTTTHFFEGWGGFAEEVTVDERTMASSLAPEAFSDEQAAGFLIPYHTAHSGLVQRGQLKAGETLLVLGGSGSSGSAAIQVGKSIGARVIAVAGTAEKEEFCKAAGADMTVNYRNGEIHSQVMELTDSAGVDVVYDPVGGASGGSALKTVARDGRFVLIGFAGGSWTRANSGDLVGRNISLVGGFMGNRSETQIKEAASDLAKWVTDGFIVPPVDKVFEFEDVPQMMGRLKRGEMLGKMVLRVSR